MSLAMSTFLLAAQGGSVLATLDERDLCTVITRNVVAYAGRKIGDVAVKTALADCRSRRIKLGLELTSGAGLSENYINSFLGTARAGVCSSDPTMVAFRQRGWKFEYTFHLPDGGTSVQTLTC